MFHRTSRKTSRRDVEAPETLKSLGSFKVSGSVSEAATSRLGLGSEGLVHIPADLRLTGFLYGSVMYRPAVEDVICGNH